MHICLAAATLRHIINLTLQEAAAFVDGHCACREHRSDEMVPFLQAALAAEDAAAEVARDPDEDAWSQASSVVSGMSAYTSATGDPAGASAAASSSGRPASTVGGRRPAKKKKGKVGQMAATLLISLCFVTAAVSRSKRPIRNKIEQDGAWHGWLPRAWLPGALPRAGWCAGFTNLAQSNDQGPQTALCLRASHKLGLQRIPACILNLGLPRPVCMSLSGGCAGTSMTLKYPCCAQAKGLRIRQGSPQEEAALAQHLRELAVSPCQAQEMGQLAELLILLGESVTCLAGRPCRARTLAGQTCSHALPDGAVRGQAMTRFELKGIV